VASFFPGHGVQCTYEDRPINKLHNGIILLLESLTYIFPLTVWVYLHSNFSGGLL